VTLASVRRRIKIIKEAVKNMDFEVAHSEEDLLRYDIMRHLYDCGYMSNKDMKMLKMILDLNDLEFPRWCA